MIWFKANASWILTVLAIIACLWIGYSCANERAAHAQAQAEIARLNGVNDSLARRGDSLAKARHVDTVKVGVAQTSYDSLKARYYARERAVPAPGRGLAEPLGKSPQATAQPPAQPTDSQVFAACDKVILALRKSVTDCDAQQSILRKQLVVSDSLTLVWKKQAPSFFQKHWGPIAIGSLVAGFVLERVIVK